MQTGLISRRRRPTGHGRRRRSWWTTRAQARRRRRLTLAGGGAVAIAAIVATALLLSTPGPRCAVAIGPDRTGSANDALIRNRRVAEGEAILRRRASCDYVLIAAVRSQVGQSEVWQHQLRGRGANPLDENQATEANLRAADARLQEVYQETAGGLTNYLSWFYEVSNAVSALPGSLRMEVWFLGDAIQTVPPVDLRRGRWTEEQVAEVLEALGPLPDLTGWSIHFVGVAQTAQHGIPTRIAENIDLFWRMFVAATGATLETFSPGVLGN